MKRLDPFHMALFPGRIKDNLLAGTDRTRLDRTRDDPAVISISRKFINILNRHPERLAVLFFLAFEFIKHLKDAHAVIPRHLIARPHDILTLKRAGWQNKSRLNIDLLQKSQIFFFHLLIYFLAVIHQIHFIDHNRDLTDPKHREHIRMPPRILLDTFFGINHQKRRLRTRSACYHIFQEFDMSRRVQNDIIPFFRFEKTPRRIDRNSLRLLVLQGIEQKRVFKRFGIPPASLLDLLELSFWKRVGICQQTTHQCTFAVVYMSDDHNVHILFFHYM